MEVQMKLKMTTSEFDRQANKIVGLIRNWWKDEQGGWVVDKRAKEAAKKDKNVMDIMSNVPVIDSKIAITVSTVLEDILGHDIPPSLIKKGGYNSIDEFITDIMAKLRLCCSSLKKAAGQN